ncbi:MAG: ABC transporter ATP-binding protein [Bacteriovoracaceae bacterium]|nr:ABC transporter ATP-binding protein [Bacteriovoracaceae bacterium]
MMNDQENEVLINLENITKSFGQVNVLQGISLKLIKGEHYVIQGASGSGKSTLLYLIGGLDLPTSGEIWAAKHKLSDFEDEQLALYRNQFIGFVFQFHFLLPSMSCLDNIFLPSRIGGGKDPVTRERIDELASKLDVLHCLNKFPFEISGGEQQRINIIRALSLNPQLLLCDEPTGNLDSVNTQKVTNLLKDLAIAHGQTLVIVTHDNNVAAHFDKRLLLKDGVVYT